MIEIDRHICRDVVKHIMGRQYVKKGDTTNPFGMVHRHAISDPCTPVMPGQGESLKTQVAHELKLVSAHLSEAVVSMIGLARRLRALTVASEIASHHAKTFKQPWQHAIPAVLR